jgi:hypothetical protein
VALGWKLACTTIVLPPCPRHFDRLLQITQLQLDILPQAVANRQSDLRNCPCFEPGGDGLNAITARWELGDRIISGFIALGRKIGRGIEIVNGHLDVRQHGARGIRDCTQNVSSRPLSQEICAKWTKGGH